VGCADLQYTPVSSFAETEGLIMGDVRSDFEPLKGIAILVVANAFSRIIANRGDISCQALWSPRSSDPADESTFFDNLLSETLGVLKSIAGNLPNVYSRIEKEIRIAPEIAVKEFCFTAWKNADGVKTFLNPHSESYLRFEEHLRGALEEGIGILTSSDAPRKSHEIGRHGRVSAFKSLSSRSSFHLLNELQSTMKRVGDVIDGVHCVDRKIITDRFFGGQASDAEIMLYAKYSRVHQSFHNTTGYLNSAVIQARTSPCRKAFA
jgi:hypothetical protein